MSNKISFTLSDYEIDQLRECINIGGGHASTALSQLTGKKINITFPGVRVTNIEDTVEVIGNSEMISTTVIVRVLGDTTGIMFFVFQGHSGTKLARMVSKIDEENEVLSDLDRSALKEIGNILSGACLSALSTFLGISVLHSVPDVATDMLGSIVNSIMAEVGRTSEISVVFDVKLLVEGEDIETHLYFLADHVFASKMVELADTIVKD